MSATLHQGDAVTWLRSLASGSVDLIDIDVAYESLEKHRAIGTTTRLTGSWFEIFRNERIPELFAECCRVLRSDRHFYFWCDQETMFVAKPIAEAAGFKFWKPLVWDKQTIGMGYHYRARYEFILFFEKGKRRLNNLGTADVLQAKRITGGYPTEKPVEIHRTLIEQSTQPGELVIDAFMGSGSAGVAAVECERSFAGNDLSPASIAMASARIPGATIADDAEKPVRQADLWAVAK